MAFLKFLPASLAASLLIAMPAIAADAPQKTSVGSVVDDSTLTARVKSALAADVGLKTVMLDIDSKDGAVIVTGKVASEDIKSRVTAAIKAVEGVRSVDNLVAVVPE